jgi:hypothetical protein
LIYDHNFHLTFEGSQQEIKRLSENLFVYQLPGCVTFMDRFGTSLHSNNYYSIYEGSSDGLLIYTRLENDTLYQGLLSRKLKEITAACYTSIVPSENGFQVIDRVNRIGFINKKGKMLVSCELEAETIDYRRDHFIVFTDYVTVPNGKMLCSGLIDSSGTLLLPPVYWEIGQFYTEIAQLRKDNKWGMINRSGELICPIIYDRIGQLHRNFIDVTKDGKMGLLDHSGKIILEANYSYVNWFDSLIHCGNDKNEHFIYDLRSLKTHQHDFGKLIQQNNGLSFYIKDNKYGLVNNQGKLLIAAQFDKVRPYRNNRAVVELNGKLGLIDEKGKIVQAINYTDLTYDKEGNYVLE